MRKKLKAEEIVGIAALVVISILYFIFIGYNTIPETKTTKNVEVTIESCEKVRAKNDDKNTLVATTEYFTVINYNGETYRLSNKWVYNECVDFVNSKANVTLSTVVYPSGRIHTYIENIIINGGAHD